MREETILPKKELATLLGRDLSSVESARYSAYMGIVDGQLEALLGYSLAPQEAGERVYLTGDGARIMYTDLFTSINGVSVGGSIVDPSCYRVYRPGQLNCGIVFDKPTRYGVQVTVNAQWGFDELPPALKLMAANMFDVVSAGQSALLNPAMKAETVLTHRVEYDNTKTAQDKFASDNQILINAWRLPRLSVVTSGEITWRNDSDISGYRPYY